MSIRFYRRLWLILRYSFCLCVGLKKFALGRTALGSKIFYKALEAALKFFLPEAGDLFDAERTEIIDAEHCFFCGFIPSTGIDDGCGFNFVGEFVSCEHCVVFGWVAMAGAGLGGTEFGGSP
jgi:hypothetical protein